MLTQVPMVTTGHDPAPRGLYPVMAMAPGYAPATTGSLLAGRLLPLPTAAGGGARSRSNCGSSRAGNGRIWPAS